jgi:phytoene desaturase
MMKFILDEVFAETGRNAYDYLSFVKLDPMYRLVFNEGSIDLSPDHEKTKAEIARLFPGQERGFDRFLEREGNRYDHMFPCLKKDYCHWHAFLRPVFLRFIRWSSPTKSLFGRLGDYFDRDMLKLSFTFQSKYLGMSPWDCPGAFTIIPMVEHRHAIYHTIGGLSAISDAMARVIEEEGGSIHLSSPVRKVIVENGTARGVELGDGTVEYADAVIVNADFGHAMGSLFEPGAVSKYSPQALEKKKLSCSTFMLYLGVDKIYGDLPHHTVVFADDYKKNVDNIFHAMELSDDISLYIRNATPLDPTIAPEGHSNIYVLVPVPNNRSGISWDEAAPKMRDLVIDTIKRKTPLTDIDDHIVTEHVITPADWEEHYAVYRGATFNLAHNMGQMLYFRPHNRLEGLKRCYIVGGGTHPGSGLPTIYESARVSAKLLQDDLGG